MINKEIPEGFKSVGKIYIVDYDNGEPYEDNMHYVDNIFYSREAAEKYLENNGLIKNENRFGATWSSPKYVCSMNNMNCKDCPKYKGEDENGWDYYDCDEYDKRWEDEWDDSFYTIEEHNLLVEDV